MPPFEWQRLTDVPPRTYVCGYCGDKVGPDKAYEASFRDLLNVPHSVRIYICSSCRQPTYFDPEGRQWPGVPIGAQVGALPPDVEAIYDEARRCMSVSAYNTAVMGARKLLMHIAYERGSGEQRNFKAYVDWLVDNHYVPPGGEGWAHHIRDRGNDANHEIDLIEQHSAEQVLAFVEMLLKFVYEMPARAGLAAPDPPTA
jgi:uncharacterized protein YlaI